MEELRDSEFMTKEEKALVLKQWRTFLKHGCRWEHFTKRVYDHLIYHCSFIAHYDRRGFYATYFETGDDRAQFLSQFDKRNAVPVPTKDGWIEVPPSIEIGGMTYWATGDDADVNMAMVEIATEYIPGLLAAARNDQRKVDMAEIERLAAKHGVEFRLDS